MGRYLLQRLVGMVLMLLLISLVSYSMVRLLPGRPGRRDARRGWRPSRHGAGAGRSRVGPTRASLLLRLARTGAPG